jgi:predicted metal-dependent peptidase
MSDFPQHQKRIDNCASRLALRLPFISTIFSSMKREISERLPTAGVKGMHVVFNPHWMDTLNEEELMFVAAHEALHTAFLHSYRVGSRDKSLWNIATDACINLELSTPHTTDGTGGAGLIMPTKDGKPVGILLPWVTRDMEAETVYQKLLERAEKRPMQGSGGWDGTGDLEEADGDSGGEGDMTEAEVTTMVLQAAKVAYASGHKSAMIERIVGIARASTTDWKEELRSAAAVSARNDYSFRRFNRRFVWQDVYLPTLYSEEIGELVVGVDVSGSVTAHQLNCIQMELHPIVEDVRPSRVVVMYCHTHVCKVETFEQGEDIRLHIPETGGTDMGKILLEIEKLNLRPAACIIFTDLLTPFPDTEPEYPLLWGAVGAPRGVVPPVGRRVEVPV